MKMSYFTCLSFFLCVDVAYSGQQTKTETIEEQEKVELKVFCSKSSEKEAQNNCQKWLEAQSKTLGNRLLTSYCGEGELQTGNSACLYKSTGELKYLLKKFKTETEKSQ